VTSPSKLGPEKGQAASTLKELIAVVGVLCLLGFVSFRAVGRAGDRTVVAQCASNLRQFAMALSVYAGESNDKLASVNSAGFWAWDLPWQVGNSLNSYGAPWQAMYCPGAATRFSPSNNYALYNYVPGQFHIVGYALSFVQPGIAASNQNYTLTPQSIVLGALTYPPPLPSRRVLIADATLRHNGSINPDGTAGVGSSWADVPGGYPLHHLSAHMSGTVPAGCNQAFLDSHVEWRPFSKMVLRSTSAAADPQWWW
jgi:hypothetical protein